MRRPSTEAFSTSGQRLIGFELTAVQLLNETTALGTLEVSANVSIPEC